ncbi:small, acid-soluble spore protein, alpha/beta type [Clostridium pasteurianum]|uniref:Small, acid-soluble spore protein, alpha/beta type n=1 Tax=Clostridium pasteurianum BC1 TaxID=86416 RepID=R4K866_CLOPA|nr:small, acid-soluble spore protein, alpha/beta type [Clostridium pasteurianum]AGK98748.1 small, acid-soluble spore protein, alpha/beta type [Clostridium pasteurianum BC1]
MVKKDDNKISTPTAKETLNKLKIEAAQGVGIPLKERANENVTPRQNASVSITKDS